MSPTFIEVPLEVDTPNDAPSVTSTLSVKKLNKARAKVASDFRSDTVTVPTLEMMQAILDASFGDDIYDQGGDETVTALQNKFCDMTGKEAALWCPSGTMGNQICLRTHLTQPPHTVLVDYRAHVQCWESGALPVISQASVTGVHPANGIHLTVDDVKKHMIPDGNIHFPPTRVVSLENTMSGVIMPLKDAKEISAYVRNFKVPTYQKPVAMHLDGARIFDGVIGEGVDLKEYCDCFDSISICLAKGAGAPMGSMIVGSREFIDRAKWYRKMLGGGTRQPGMMAGAALAGLPHALSQFPAVHRLTRSVAQQLQAIGYTFRLPVQTNMMFLDMQAAGITGEMLVDYCRRYGVFVFDNGRIVFHSQITEYGAQSLVKALTELWNDCNDDDLGRVVQFNSGNVKIF